MPRYSLPTTTPASERKSVDALVAKELLDFVSTHAESLSADVDGFADAFLWPDPHAAAGTPTARG